MPFDFSNLPWWAYVAILIVIAVIGFIVYHYATKYSPATIPLDASEPGLPANFDPEANAQAAYNALTAFTGPNNNDLLALSNLNDNELKAVYNSFNQDHYSDLNETLTQAIAGIITFITSTDTRTIRDQLVSRMQNLGLV